MNMDVATAGFQLEEQLGRKMKPQVAKAHLAYLCGKHPELLAATRMAAAAHDGPLVRSRADVLYSTVFFVWDGAGAAPTVAPTLFERGIGDQDPNLGAALTELHTNLPQGAKMDSSQQFRAQQFGFRIYTHSPGSAVLLAQNIMLCHQRLWTFVAARLGTGVQTSQILGPIEQFVLPQVAFAQNGLGLGAAGNLALTRPTPTMGPTQAWQLKPNQVFGAGQTYRIPLFLQPGVLPGGAGFESIKLAVCATWYGKSLTTIDG